MTVNTNNLVSITEANQNFSKVARLVDENGSAVILKNNVPRYLIVEFSQAETIQVSSDEDVMEISKRLIEKNRLHMRYLPNEKTDKKSDTQIAYRTHKSNRWYRRSS